MLEKLREQRREHSTATTSAASTKTSPSGLDEIVDEERARASTAASTRRSSPATSAARRLLDELAQERRLQLDSCRPTSRARCSELQQYDLDVERGPRSSSKSCMEELKKQLCRLDVQPAAAGHVGDVARAARSA